MVSFALSMKAEAFQKTEALNPKRFRQGKQPWRVATALTKLSNPVSFRALVETVTADGYDTQLNEWAKEHGGVEASVRYQLKYLRRLGMVTL